MCVYQGCIETMIALGLEDRIGENCYGLDNPVKEEWEEGLSPDELSGGRFLLRIKRQLYDGTGFDFLLELSVQREKSGQPDSGLPTEPIPISTNTRPADDQTLENEYTDLLNISESSV